MEEIKESDEKRLMRLEVENEHLNKRLDIMDEKFADLQNRFNDLLRRQKELEESNTEITDKEFVQSDINNTESVHIEYNKHKERKLINKIRGIFMILFVLAIIYIFMTTMWSKILTLNYTLNDIPIPEQKIEKKSETISEKNSTVGI